MMLTAHKNEKESSDETKSETKGDSPTDGQDDEEDAKKSSGAEKMSYYEEGGQKLAPDGNNETIGEKKKISNEGGNMIRLTDYSG